MSSLFLFGAGASFGSGPCTPSNPPLGKDFFPSLKKTSEAAKVASPELEALFNKNFEEAMNIYFDIHHKHIRKFLNEMAVYFSKFKPEKGNYYQELMDSLVKSRKKYTISTTNYDLLIEHPILKTGKSIIYNSESTKDEGISLLKIHGSANFLPDPNIKSDTHTNTF